MRTTKTLNYLNFLDYGSRMPSGPIATHWPETVEKTEKSGIDAIIGKIITKGVASKAFVVYTTGASHWIKSCNEGVSGWIDCRARDIDFHRIYSAGGRATVQPLESSSDFRHLRNKIRSFQKLARGWDSYQADAPSERAVSAALQLVDELEHAEILPEWVTPTSDSSILMRYRQGDVWYDWEFHSDGDVAVLRKPLFDKETYHDFDSTEIASFFPAQNSAQ